VVDDHGGRSLTIDAHVLGSVRRLAYVQRVVSFHIKGATVDDLSVGALRLEELFLVFGLRHRVLAVSLA